jgi:iron complex transport system substrate-binding protein
LGLATAFVSAVVLALSAPLPAFSQAAAGWPLGTARGVPQRIVSLNVCTDQILIDLVPAERIAGLSWLATDPTLSAIARRAGTFAGVRDNAEEVLALDPDLVIAQEYSATATVSLLQRLGRKVLMVPTATDFEGIRRAVRSIAAAVGEFRRGEAIVERFDARLAAVKVPAGHRPTALAYEVSSLAAGPSTLLDAAMTVAGFDNLARTDDLGPAGRLPLETLVAAPPDLLILANGPKEFRSVAADNLRHPALDRLLQRRPSLHIAMPEWLCGTPEVAGAVEKLAAARAGLTREAARGGAR